MILPFKDKVKDSDSLNCTFLYILIHCVKAAAHHIKKKGKRNNQKLAANSFPF